MINKLSFWFNSLLKLLILLYNRWEKKVFAQYIPNKPKGINLNANDICNSHCVMCNIWKRKKEFEISPIELRQILKNKLFTEVEHVGITGGEPTLRKDLPELYEAVIQSLPKLKGVSIITNGINEEEVLDRILKVNTICEKNKIPFAVMVSIDGVGKVHDGVRGTKNNFTKSVKLINYLKNNTHIPVSVGCTISKVNVWKVDELLDYLKENKIYGRFRIAEHINRLYNTTNSKVIRNFTEEEKYHLQLFFCKLKDTFEQNEKYKRTYQSIIEMLEGKARKIGCPYHADGVVLNSRGELSYCAPKSKNIGSALEQNALKLFNSNLSERRRIIKNDCSNCIHDYHAPITYSEYREKIKIIYSQAKLKHYDKMLKMEKLLPYNILWKNTNLIFIIGWYGTETVGDKAILASIIKSYKEKYNDRCKFVIGSIFPFVTRQTLKELSIEGDVIDSRTYDLVKYSIRAKEVVMGGGPLMDLESLNIPLTAFKSAKRFNNRTVLFGCGLGPLSSPDSIKNVKIILGLSDEILVRDTFSYEIAKEWTKRNDIIISGDPAEKAVLDVESSIESNETNVLACYFREWKYAYSKDISHKEFLEKKEKFEEGLAKKIKFLINEYGFEKVRFYHMHNFYMGSDDREFSRKFISKYFSNNNNVLYEIKLSTIESIITAMKSSRLNLCMRFHSVLFANILNVDFLAIDYTQGGKIEKYLKDKNKLDRIIKIDSLINKKINETTTGKYIR